MHTLYLHNTTHLVPSNLRELRATQLARILEILHSAENALVARWLVLIELLELKKLRNWRTYLFLRYGNPTAEESHELLRLTDWLFNQPTTLTIQLMPTVSVRRGWFQFAILHGPADAMAASSFREFVRALRYYADYLTSGDTDHLNLFVACLYRLPHQKAFNDESYTQNVPFVEAMTVGERLLVAKFFEGCLAYFKHSYPYVFPKPVKADAAPLTGAQLQDMWVEINMQISADPTKDEATFDQPLHNILKRLDLQIKRNLDLKSAAAK